MSLGVVIETDRRTATEALVEQAHQLLHETKRAGNACVVVQGDNILPLPLLVAG